jgi:hypothetical protein
MGSPAMGGGLPLSTGVTIRFPNTTDRRTKSLYDKDRVDPALCVPASCSILLIKAFTSIRRSGNVSVSSTHATRALPWPGIDDKPHIPAP